MSNKRLLIILTLLLLIASGTLAQQTEKTATDYVTAGVAAQRLYEVNSQVNKHRLRQQRDRLIIIGSRRNFAWRETTIKGAVTLA
jgi:hypothetical protein